MKQERAATPPPPQTPAKPALTEKELSKKSTAIIEEYLHINDMKVPFRFPLVGVRYRFHPSHYLCPPPSPLQEALQCVQEMNSTQLLSVFVRNGLESTLERSTIAREHMGLLLQQLIKAGVLPTEQYYHGSVWTPPITPPSGSVLSCSICLCGVRYKTGRALGRGYSD